MEIISDITAYGSYTVTALPPAHLEEAFQNHIHRKRT